LCVCDVVSFFSSACLSANRLTNADHPRHKCSLLQTFYKKIVRASPEPTSHHHPDPQAANPESTSPHPAADSDAEDEEENDRGVENRLYIKELLITHPIWKDGNYWEQTLWQCAIEQVRAMKLSEDLCSSDSRNSTASSAPQTKVRGLLVITLVLLFCHSVSHLRWLELPLTEEFRLLDRGICSNKYFILLPTQLQAIPYDRAWHDMTKDERRQAVRRVHEVIFSQVMAITHSMLELGCSARQSREFLYRMCVIHQLSEAMRQSLLKHVNAAASTSTRRPSRIALDMRGRAHSDASPPAPTPAAGDAPSDKPQAATSSEEAPDNTKNTHNKGNSITTSAALPVSPSGAKEVQGSGPETNIDDIVSV